jgi:hypothetical protein
MKEIRKAFNLTFRLLLCFLFFPLAESIAQVKDMSTKDLTEKSSAVLYGRCSKVKSEWNENKSIIYTYVTVVPEGYIKGNLGSEAVLAVPGGRVGDIIYEVSEMPVFTEGEEVVAFIWTNPAGKNLVTGGYKGKMKIEKDSKTGKRMVLDESLEDGGVPTGGQGKKNYGQLKKMSLEDFTVKVKGYVKNKP